MKKLIFSYLFIMSTILLIGQTSSQQLLHIITAQDNFQKEKYANSASQWPILNKATIKKERKYLHTQIANLKSLDKTTLSESEQINQELLLLILEDDLFKLDYGQYLMPLNAEGGFLTGMVYRTQSLRLNSAEERTDYLKKLQAVPAYLQQQTSLLKRGLKDNKVVPKIIVKNCIGYVEDYLNTPIEDLFLAQPLATFQEQDKEGLTLLKAQVIPAFRAFKTFLEKDYLPNTRSVAVSYTHLTLPTILRV